MTKKKALKVSRDFEADGAAQAGAGTFSGHDAARSFFSMALWLK